MQNEYIYEFKYAYDKVDLLRRVEKLLPTIGIHLVRSDPESNAGGQDCWRIRVDSHLDDPDCAHIYKVCEPIINIFGSKDWHIRVQYYTPESFLGWHYDHPKGSGITKVNLLLTEQRQFEDRLGNKYDFETCIANATMFEHQFDNRGLPKRCFIRIGLQDVPYTTAKEIIDLNNGNIPNK